MTNENSADDIVNVTRDSLLTYHVLLKDHRGETRRCWTAINLPLRKNHFLSVRPCVFVPELPHTLHAHMHYEWTRMPPRAMAGGDGGADVVKVTRSTAVRQSADSGEKQRQPLRYGTRRRTRRSDHQKRQLAYWCLTRWLSASVTASVASELNIVAQWGLLSGITNQLKLEVAIRCT